MSFESAAWLVALVGTSIGPWRLLGDARGFVWVWLVGHAALLAPVAGVLLADYHVVRRRTLDLDGLYDRTEPAEDGAGGGAYWYGNGTNGVALLAFAFGACFLRSRVSRRVRAGVAFPARARGAVLRGVLPARLVRRVRERVRRARGVERGIRTEGEALE